MRPGSRIHRFYNETVRPVVGWVDSSVRNAAVSGNGTVGSAPIRRRVRRRVITAAANRSRLTGHPGGTPRTTCSTCSAVTGLRPRAARFAAIPACTAIAAGRVIAGRGRKKMASFSIAATSAISANSGSCGAQQAHDHARCSAIPTIAATQPHPSESVTTAPNNVTCLTRKELD